MERWIDMDGWMDGWMDGKTDKRKKENISY